MVNQKILSTLKAIVTRNPGVVFGFLFGSQITGADKDANDWDFAIYWDESLEFWDKLGRVEELRRQLANALGVGSDKPEFRPCGETW